MISPVRLSALIRYWAVITYRMLRIRTVLLMVTFEAIGYEAVKPTKGVSLEFLLVAGMLSALYVCATCFNDAADEEIDKVNLPNDVSRPLVTTATTGRQLQTLGAAALIVALLAAVMVKPAYLLFVIAGATLNIFYSVPPIRVSYRGIFASLWLSLSYVAIPFWAGALISNSHISNHVLYVFLGIYSCFVSRILLKDFRDYIGDIQFGKLNFLVRHGPKLTCLVSGAAWLIGDIVLSISLYRTSAILVYLIQPLSLVVFYELYILAREKRYKSQLYEVAVIGRMGNAAALAILTSLSLQAFDYSVLQNNLSIIVVGLIVASTAVDPSLLRRNAKFLQRFE